MGEINRKSCLKLIYDVLQSDEVQNRYCMTAIYDKQGVVKANIWDCIKFIEELYKEECDK